MCDFYRMVKSKQDELDLNTCNYTRRSSLDYNAIDKLVIPKETLSKKCSSENAVSSPNTLQRLTFPRFAIHKDFGIFFPTVTQRSTDPADSVILSGSVDP